ncbi:MAG TPA: PEGA domain-containing protein [Gammaproteobacteria bacterium]
MTTAADWVLATEESGHTRHFAAAALPIVIGDTQGADIRLAGVTGVVQIGQLDGVFFAQPGKQTENARLDGQPLRGSRRIQDGNVIALDSARLKCALRGGRLTLSIEARVTAGDTAPPDLEEVARASAEMEIAPVAFRRSVGTDRGEKRRVSKTTVIVASVAAIFVIVAWFAFTAKSVAIVFEPPVDSYTLPRTLFKLGVGDRHLLRSGSHVVRAELAGYYPLDTRIEVGAESNQTFRLTLTKLPGLVTLATAPEVGAQVKVDGNLLGTTPLVDVEIIPGTHQVEFSAERFLSQVLELVVTGGNERQTLTPTLTPNWALVTVASEPAGASVSVDGAPAGTTPAALELAAGFRDVELTLSGYNAWQQRVTVVANEPQTLPPVRLVAADGRVQLTTVPADAAVSVDGTFRGRTPLQLRLAPGRAHEIAITKPGYDTVRRELSVAADSGRTLEIELVGQFGEVDVQSNPANAEIWVDDRLVGVTPARLNLMAIGHELEVRLAGYAPQAIEITPRPGFLQAEMFELEELDTTSGGGYPRTITTSLGQELKIIPAGRFRMGSARGSQGFRPNEVAHDVEISRAFYLGVHEVTNAEFRKFEAAHDSGTFSGQALNGDDQPVVRVEWEDVARFMNWLSIEDGLQPVYDTTSEPIKPFRPLRNGYRLPTEAEWSWAARAAGRDAPIVYPWGNALPPPDRTDNFADIAAAEVLPTTLVIYTDGFAVSAPVGSFAANPVGIFDLGGNVAEWVQDFYEISVTTPPEGVTVDPLGPETGGFHVLQGPSWRSASVTDLRLAYRNYSSEGREDVGFRIARNLE